MFLNLLQIRFPVMAITSILHRISGVWLFLVSPLAVYFLYESSVHGASFDHLKAIMASLWYLKLVVWISLVALYYHIFAGVRHLIMDLGFGESLRAGRFSARLIIVLAIVMAVVLGVYIW